MLRVVVLVSGGGTNLQAIFDALDAGEIKNVQVVGVLSNNKNAFALERAAKRNVNTKVVSPKTFSSREDFNEAFLLEVKEWQPDLIVLAGFLVAIPAAMIQAYPNQILNIHPSLIPSFCGKGFYGLKVHEEALKRGVRLTGATVHFVDQGTDTGPIVFQKAVEVKPGDTPLLLQKRVMEEAEWKLLPKAIQWFADGKI